MTTHEAAVRAGVGPTAVKRWADQGLLPCVRTPGGHRRFEESAVLAFMKSMKPGVETERSPAEAWIDTLLAASSSHETEAQLLLLRAREGAWYRVAQFLGTVLTALGEAYARGELTIIEEHVVSERLFRAVVSIAETLPVAPNAELALMVMAEGDEHVLGLALAELCFRESGHRTLWSGRFTPASELAAFVAESGAKLVAASASSSSGDGAALARWVKKVGAACDAAGATLVIGGSGSWPEVPRHGVRIESFESLHAFLNRRR